MAMPAKGRTTFAMPVLATFVVSMASCHAFIRPSAPPCHRPSHGLARRHLAWAQQQGEGRLRGRATVPRQWARPAPPAAPSPLSAAATDAADSPAAVDAAAIKEVGIKLAVSGALLGPCHDNYHSAFGVLKYNAAAVPLTLTVGGNELLHTAAFVPPLFGFAAVLIGGLYVLLDQLLDTPVDARSPSPPAVLCGISFFTGQYWLSGLLAGPYAAAGLPLAATHAVLLVTGLLSWQLFDRTRTGFAVGLMTAVGGTVIEMGLINFLGLYNYLAADLLGVDSWIPWVVSEGLPIHRRDRSPAELRTGARRGGVE